MSTIGKDISLMIVANARGSKKTTIVAELETVDLSARVKARPDLKYHEISTCHSCSPVQVIMSCSVKPFLSFMNNPSGVTATGGAVMQPTTDEPKVNYPSMAEGGQSLSRDFLESNYTQIRRVGDRNIRAHGLNLVGMGFHQLYHDNHEVADLERVNAVSIHEETMQCTSLFDLRFARHSNDLGGALMERFSLKGDIMDIENAISLCKDAVKVTNDADKDAYRWLVNLGNCHILRFDRFHDTEDINRAIFIWKRATKLMENDDPSFHVILGNLGSSLQKRFGRSGSLADLAEAISVQQKAVDSIQDTHPDKPKLLSNLGSCIQLRFEQFGDAEDLETAIILFQAAVNLAPDGHPNKPGLLSNLGASAQLRFERWRHQRSRESNLLISSSH